MQIDKRWRGRIWGDDEDNEAAIFGKRWREPRVAHVDEILRVKTTRPEAH